MTDQINLASSAVTPAQVTEFNARGFDGLIGLTITELTPDRAVAEWTITPALHQASGVVHGGVYAAVVESLSSTAAWAWLNRDGGPGGVALGVSNTTDFLRAVSSGDLRAVAEPVHRGRQQQLWRVTVTNPADEKLIVQGQVRLQNVAWEQK